MRDFEKVYKGFKFGCDLKKTVRTGYLRRNVPDPESSADHSFGVAYLSILLDDFLPKEINREKLYKLCILHDLPECIAGDIPPEDMTDPARYKAEAKAATIIAETGENNNIKELWNEYENAETLEGKIAKDIDKLETLMQVLYYVESGDMAKEKNDFFRRYLDGDRTLRTDLGRDFFDYLVETHLNVNES